MDELLEFTVHCAFESGRIQRKSFQKAFGIHHKGEINLVTDVDIACQTRIMELISAAFPEDDIVSEEKVNDYPEGRNRWIIDPLDGTTNYAHGYPFFCTSIAYEKAGEVILGAVYNPIFHELFYCRKEQGAYLNGEKLSVSRQGDLKNALLTTGFPYDLPTTKRTNIENFVEFLFKAQAIRRDGSAALNLCYLACARFDGFWELSLNPWDTAAGCLMVTEAGGMVSDFAGEKFSIYGREIVASNGVIHEDMLAVLNADRNRRQ
jgi:myo-inositol-1(or 4)-monophosphatase